MTYGRHPRRYKQRVALITWLNGETHRADVMNHHHIYSEGDDYVVGCFKTGCEMWRQPKALIAVVQLRDELKWLT